MHPIPHPIMSPFTMSGVGALYFLNAFTQSFPAVAFGQWLFETLHLSPSMTNIYYSISFLPYNFKVFFGYLSDHVGTRAHPGLLLACYLILVGIFLLTPTLSSVTAACVMKFGQSSIEAWSQLLLGLAVVQWVSRKTLVRNSESESSRVQALVVGWGNAGSIAALVVGLPIYQARVPVQSIIQLTAIVPVVSIVVLMVGWGAFQCRESRFDFGSVDPSTSQKRSYTIHINERQSQPKNFNPLFHKNNPDSNPKWWTMIQVKFTLFLLLWSTLPSDQDTWYQFQFSILDQVWPVGLQLMGLVSMVGRTMGCCMYYRMSCGNPNWTHAFRMGAWGSCIFGSGFRLILALMSKHRVSSRRFDNIEIQCGLLILESFVSSVTAQFLLLPLLAHITTLSSGSRASGTVYSLYLSILDLGGFLAGLASAGIVSLLHMNHDDDDDDDGSSKSISWEPLWILILISAMSRIVMLYTALPFFVDIEHIPGSRSSNNSRSPLSAEVPLLDKSSREAT